MNDYAICPYCDVVLEVDDTYDNDYDSGKYIDLVVGHCPNCNKNFKWREIYLFDRAEEIEEEENE